MKKRDKTKKQLTTELRKLQQFIAELEAPEAERKKAEEALQESEETFRALAENANDGIFVTVGKGVYAYANKRASVITGYSVAELLKSGIKDLVHPDELEKVMERYRKRLTGEPVPPLYETIIIRKDGKSLPIELTAAKTIWQGQPADLVIIRDTTERKQSEQTLRESEEKYRNLVERANDGIGIAQDGILYYVNPRLAKIIGYSVEELIGSPFPNFFIPDEVPKVVDRYKRRMAGEIVLHVYESALRHKNGSRIEVELNAGIIPYKGKTADLVLVRDITERKQAEGALQHERNLVNRIMETSPAAITMVDRQGKITFANTRAEKVLGLTKDDITQRSYNTPAWHITDYEGNPFPDDQLPFQQVMRTGKPVFDVCHAIEWPDGRRVLFSINGAPLRDESGQIDGVVFSIEDITERKKVEERLRESEERYKTLFDEALVGICLADAETGIIIDCNRALAALVCRERAELIGRPQTILHPPQNDKAAFSPTFKQHLTDKEGQILETRVVTRTGDIREVEIKANLLDLQGRKLLQGLFHDITERKRAEAALRESEEKYRMIVENSRDIIFTLGHAGEFVYLSPAISDVLGYSQAELIGHTFQSLIHPEDQPVVQDVLRRNITEGYQTSGTEYRVRHASGEWRWHMARGSVVRNEKDDFLYFTGVAQDITERKQAEDRLKESEAKYRSLVENSLEGISLSRGDRLFFANQALLNMTGYETAEEFLHVPLLEHIAPESRDLIRGILKKQQRGKPVPARFSFKIVRKDGDIRDLEASFAEALVEGEPCIQSTFRDVTERKRAEEALRESEEKYRELVENINDILYATDENGIVTYIAPTIEFLSGYTTSEIIGHPFSEFVYQEDLPLAREEFQEVVSGQVKAHEYRMVNKSGVVRWVRTSSRSLFRETRFVGLRGVMTDITDRKQAEEEVKRGYEQLQETLHATVNALASTVEMKDQYTAGHQPRATHLACAIAEEMGLSNEQIEGIRMAASIHDIGKIVVPAEILNKPGPLTEIQYEMIKMHPRAGFDVVKGIKFPWPVAQIVLQHHELMDGSGYPQKLSGDEIMMEARILTVANVVEAMNSHRPYRPAYDIKEALAEIAQKRGVLYDSAAVDACLALFERGFRFD